MSAVLIADNVSKKYHLGRKKTRIAVDGLDLEVPEGVIFGFLGPNGAGKTTTIKMILDFVKPTSGSLSIFGSSTNNASARRRIGFMPEQPYFLRFLKPIEVVSMHAELAGLPNREVNVRSLRSLKLAGIAEYANTSISKLSKGLTQRVGIAQALVGDPDLLILDEPTSGLDPIGRRHTRELLCNLRDEGKTIFLSSHVLSEIEDLCDLVAIMKQGRLVSYGKPSEITEGESSFAVSVSGLTLESADRLRFVSSDACISGHTAQISVKRDVFYETMQSFGELGLTVDRIETRQETLEEAFLRLAA